MPITIRSIFFFHLHLLLLIKSAYSKCPQTFNCGHISFEFPLTTPSRPECGLFFVDCNPNPIIQLNENGAWFEILEKQSQNKFRVRAPWLQPRFSNRSCIAFEGLTEPNISSISSFSFSPNLTMFICENAIEIVRKRFEHYRSYSGCEPDFKVYYPHPTSHSSSGIVDDLNDVPDGCYVRQLPAVENDIPDTDDIFKFLKDECYIEWNVSDECISCHRGGGQCLSDRGGLYCKKDKNKKIILIAALSAVILLLIVCFVASIIYYRKKRNQGTYVLSRNLSSVRSSKSELEAGSFHYGVHLFSYAELEEATDKFDPSKELGDGGFGTVYYGKLRDGREVAIKRLYEHNCKRVEQFMNEVRILTCLRHPNLVLLYGCTSRRSRELLLVYEYIRNGTVADHLYGDRAKESPLTWPVRMNIAIETASALAYLHKSDIIHRDVKTNNILLDENFCVKVADFGLSRLFPNDVTHVSTAPQGTPGYVDPEYHQCYQLTEKSDVYSFGVVLVELISSMPAVDISRHRHEINLANLAMNRIQRCAFDELIDSFLGYDTDPEVTRMTTSVAEIAFQCLQLDKDARPSMDEVLEFLKGTQGGEKMRDFNDGKIPPSPETDDVILLKNKNYQSSPIAVTDVWISGSTTSTSSIG